MLCLICEMWGPPNRLNETNRSSAFSAGSVFKPSVLSIASADSDRGATGSRAILRFVHLSLDIGQLRLHEARRVANTLVVDRGAKFTDEEVEQSFGAEVAQRV